MPTSRRAHRIIGLGLVAAALIGGQATSALAAGPTTLVPIGSDYQPDTLQLFAREAANRSTDAQVHILVLPITYSLSADSTTKSERKKNLTLADNRRGQVETACNAVKAPAQSCLVELVPVLVRSDALSFDPAPYFTADLDGMYVLGGDQTVAMNTVHDTPLESAMTSAFVAGAVFGGNSAGAAVQSVDMINGYTGSNGPAESMQQGAVEVCTPEASSTCVRGMPFGFSNLITDQHVFEYGRTGRSLNVALSMQEPVLGVDAATGAVVTDETALRDVTGDTVAYVIDPGTYDAARAWGGPTNTLSTTGVAMHVLAPGGDGFDFGAMQPTHDGVATPAPALGRRSYPAFATPAGSGPLYLGGGLMSDLGGLAVDAFAASAGGPGASVVVLATGYPKNAAAQADAKAVVSSLAGRGISASWFVVDEKSTTASVVAALDGANGVVLLSPDRSRVAAALATQPAIVDAAHAAWVSGAAVLADDAAAAVLGSTFIADGISPDVEASAPEDLLPGGVTFGTGLGWVSNVDVEPRLLPDQSWGQLLRLASMSTATPAAGIDVGTALVVDGGTASVVGDSAVVVMDTSHATFGTGSPNGALSARWILLDSYTDGMAVAP